MAPCPIFSRILYLPICSSCMASGRPGGADGADEIAGDDSTRVTTVSLHTRVRSTGGKGGTVMKRTVLVTTLAALAYPIVLFAHPHFNKTVTAKLPSGADATIAYNTTAA